MNLCVDMLSGGRPLQMNLQLARAVLSDTEGLPKSTFKPLILKGEKAQKCRTKGVVPERHLNTLETA